MTIALRKASIFLATIFALMSGTVVQAAECADTEDQAMFNQCAALEFNAADVELNDLYHQIRQRLADDADARRLLRDTERSWIAFRDAECAFAASATVGGSAYPMVHGSCLTDLTQQRADQLQHYLAAEEGDLTSPVPPAQ